MLLTFWYNRWILTVPKYIVSSIMRNLLK